MAQALKGSPGRQNAGTTPRPTVLSRGSQLPPGMILSGGGKSAVASVTHASQQSASTNVKGSAMSNPTQASMTPPQAGVVLAPQSASSLVPQAGIGQTQHSTTRGVGQPLVATSTEQDQSLANTKEKTPMCLINELARFNKVQHQYMLTDEQGPAHKKTFFVKLKLAEEEYAASGPSIKKAQHAAAAIALEKTALKHPPPKPSHNASQAACDGNPSITPTVELNALAMKRGEPAVYRAIEPARPQYYNNQPNFDFRGMYNQRYHYPKMPRIFYMSLKVGQREFIGEGATRQAARHNAAEKALKVLRCLTVPGTDTPSSISVPDKKKEREENDEEEEEEEDEETASDDLKSEISLVHEIALKRGLSVNFEITKESGPPHMRTFVTRCTCGTYISEGTGNSKKVSKKRAAELMLEELKKLPQLPQQVPKPKKMPGNKKKNRNLIKLQKANMDYGVGINPISRLIQIQQAKKEREPVYTLVAERGLPRRREFVMQVTVGEEVCTGVGPNKKLAKRNAAEQMLQQLGYSRPSPQPNKSSIKSPSSEGGSGGSDKKVKFLDQEHGTARQLVPGVLVLPDGARGHNSSAPGSYTSLVNQAASYSQSSPENDNARKNTAAIAKELLDTGASPTAEALAKSGTTMSNGNQTSVRPVQQLLYLAHVLGFKVEFSDFPKGTDKEHLSLVMLSTCPPHVSHGSGPTVDASHDMAALTALQELAKMGLDKVTPAPPADNTETHSVGPSGNGPGSGDKWVKSEVEAKVKTETQ